MSSSNEDAGSASRQEGLRMIEFFSGIGGMRLSVSNAIKQQQQQQEESTNNNNNNNTMHLAFCQAYDISIHANRTYKHNFQNDLVSTKLVEQLKPRDLDGKADLWTMSPPCQPFTKTRCAKNLDLEDKRCNGLKAIIKLLTDIQDKPRHILLENVKGFAVSQMIEAFYKCLEENGYTWKEYLISPIHFGIPNHRQRYYILCERSKRWASLRQQQQTEPQTSFYGQEGENVNGATTAPPSMRRVGDYLAVNSVTLTHEHQKNELMVPRTVLEQPWAAHLGIVTLLDEETHCFTAGYGRIFHKATGSLLLLHENNNNDNDNSNEPSIRARDLDRSDMTLYHGRLRRFSPRELLNIFGFPSDFDFPSDISLEHRYKLIGNSINVTVVTELVKELLSSSPSAAASNIGMEVGGSKGHQTEYIQGALRKLYESYRWKMIPNCTGRHTCRDHKLVTTLPPLAVLERAGIVNKDSGQPLEEYRFSLPNRADPVAIVSLDCDNTTGVITFVKKQSNEDDGGVSQHYVHTLNTVSGFRRKLESIGIQVTATQIGLTETINDCDDQSNLLRKEGE